MLRRCLFALVLWGSLAGALIFSEDAGPQLHVRSAILVDATTGTVLFEQNADESIPPASLAKLMTMYLALSSVESGEISLHQDVDIPEAAWARNQEIGSSLMFLGPGQRVNLEELLVGLSVASGNDAAIAVALALSPSIEHFAYRMTETARAMGLSKTSFVEPAGISELNTTTAREFSLFCRRYLQRFPQALATYHQRASIAYPQQRNLVAGSAEPILQFNRNRLLQEVTGVDGLKTGFIREAGYNFALCAERDGTRLLAVLLGGYGESKAEGERLRSLDGRAILEWGFSRFKTMHPVVASLAPVRVWKGQHNAVAVQPGAELAFTYPVGGDGSISYRVEHDPKLLAPVAAGQRLGRIVFSEGDLDLHEVPLIATQGVRRAHLVKRLYHGALLFFRALLGMES